MKVIWKDIDEFDGDYQISNLGRLKSVARIVNGPKGEVRLSDRMLSQVVNKRGYIEYQITHNGKHYSRKAHRLVALAFIDNPDGLPQVNHIDGNKQNNAVDNLEWCDNRHNVFIDKGTGQHQSNTVYGSNGVSPCLNAVNYKEPLKTVEEYDG